MAGMGGDGCDCGLWEWVVGCWLTTEDTNSLRLTITSECCPVKLPGDSLQRVGVG